MKEKEELEVEEEGGLLGTFVSDAHITIGTAIINIEFFLYFTNSKTDIGPKLLSYLSTIKYSADYVYLCDIKGVNSNYTCAIPENKDL